MRPPRPSCACGELALDGRRLAGATGGVVGVYAADLACFARLGLLARARGVTHETGLGIWAFLVRVGFDIVGGVIRVVHGWHDALRDRRRVRGYIRV